MRAKPQVIWAAKAAWTSRYSPSSTTAAMTFFMSYGWFGESGMMPRSSGHRRSAGSPDVMRGGSSMLFEGKKDRR